MEQWEIKASGPSEFPKLVIVTWAMIEDKDTERSKFLSALH